MCDDDEWPVDQNGEPPHDCDTCEGTGLYDPASGDKPYTCPECEGSGKVFHFGGPHTRFDEPGTPARRKKDIAEEAWSSSWEYRLRQYENYIPWGPACRW